MAFGVRAEVSESAKVLNVDLCMYSCEGSVVVLMRIVKMVFYITDPICLWTQVCFSP